MMIYILIYTLTTFCAESLDLSNNNIWFASNIGACEAFRNALMQLTSLKRLSLAGNRLGERRER